MRIQITLYLSFLFLIESHAQSQEAYLFSVGEITLNNNSGSVSMHSLVGQTVYEQFLNANFSFVNFPSPEIDLIEGLEPKQQVLLYPNPMVNHLFIEGDHGLDFSFKIYNALGGCEMFGTFNGQSSIDVSGLKSGIYLFVLLSSTPGSKAKSFKIVKSNER